MISQLQENALANANAEVDQAQQILNQIEGATAILMSIPPLHIVPQNVDHVKDNEDRLEQLDLLKNQTELFNNALRDGVGRAQSSNSTSRLYFFDANAL